MTKDIICSVIFFIVYILAVRKWQFATANDAFFAIASSEVQEDNGKDSPPRRWVVIFARKLIVNLR